MRPAAVPAALRKGFADFGAVESGVEGVTDVAFELFHVLLTHQYRQHHHHAFLDVERRALPDFAV